MKEYEYHVKFGWRFNPFTLSISPDLLVGYSSQTSELLAHIHNSHKFGLILGPTGSGKTTILLWLKTQLKAYKKFKVIYVSKPPTEKEEMVELFVEFFKPSIIDKIFRRSITIYSLPDYLKDKTKNHRFVLLLDETHESTLQVLEWIRTLTDLVPNMTTVMAALPPFYDMLQKKLPTLAMRVTTKVSLGSLSRTETEDLIRKRIDKAGGDGIKPFTIESIDEIFKVTGGFPREIIKLCDTLIREAFKKNLSTITPQLVYEVAKPKPDIQEEVKSALSKKQVSILEILNDHPNLTPSQIVEYLDKSEYKDKNNAVRAVNNILKRLLADGFVERRKQGNTYTYNLTGKAKTLFAKA
ncbi:MAG: AAA family ATPase [Candidatus Aenigmarchaeota archaeon]|nr:AAA family ATPase [Candidatus Aenigmarchaeota archaeon]